MTWLTIKRRGGGSGLSTSPRVVRKPEICARLVAGDPRDAYWYGSSRGLVQNCDCKGDPQYRLECDAPHQERTVEEREPARSLGLFQSSVKRHVRYERLKATQ